jgi:hypothetical protein
LSEEGISDHLIERFLNPIDEELARVRKERETLEGQLALVDDDFKRLTRLRKALVGPAPGPPKGQPLVTPEKSRGYIAEQRVEDLYEHMLTLTEPATVRQLGEQLGWHESGIRTGLEKLRAQERARLAGQIKTPNAPQKSRVYAAIPPRTPGESNGNSPALAIAT